MGFNLGSFAAGALKTLSENVKEQSDTQDADAKRYLEAGIAEGKAATKAYRAENKSLKELGSQLDSQGFDNNQIKLVLKGGAASTKDFIQSVKKAKQLTPNLDLSKWVQVDGKPSSASWQDYITNVIQGIPDKEAAESYYVAPKSNSILGSYLNNGSPSTDSRITNTRYDQQAAKMSAGMGINVKDVVAAGTGNMVYDLEMQVSGNINTEDKERSLSYTSMLATSKYMETVRPLNIKSIRNQLAKDITQKERARLEELLRVEQRKVETIAAKGDLLVAQYNIDTNANVTILKSQLQAAEKSMINSQVPDSYKDGLMLYQQLKMQEEEKGLDANPELLLEYEAKVDSYQLQYTNLLSIQTGATQDLSYSALNNAFNNIFEDELIQLQGSDNASYDKVANNTGGFVIRYVGKRSVAAFDNYQQARAKAAVRFRAAMGDNTQGINYKLMEGVLDNQNAYAQTTDPKDTNTKVAKKQQVSYDTFRPYEYPKGSERIAPFEIIPHSTKNLVSISKRGKADADGNKELIKFVPDTGQTVVPEQAYVVERYDADNKIVYQILNGADLMNLRLARPTSSTGLMAPGAK
jgi:hypothetical protein